MSIRSLIRNTIIHQSQAGFDANKKGLQVIHDVDQSLNWLLHGQDAADRNDAVNFVRLVRECIEPAKCQCRGIKGFNPPPSIATI
jgi:hypothetical protein